MAPGAAGLQRHPIRWRQLDRRRGRYRGLGWGERLHFIRRLARIWTTHCTANQRSRRHGENHGGQHA